MNSGGLADIASGFVRRYPFRRGRYWVRSFAARRFLTAKSPDGHRFRVSGASGFEWKLFDRKFNEPRTDAVFKLLVNASATVFDVGANIGYYTIVGASLLRGRGTVHAFEPTPEVARRLADNVAMNDLSQAVRCQAVAVGDANGHVNFHLDAEDSEGNSVFGGTGMGRRISVPMITIDDYLAQYGITTIDVMKVDVEGAELAVLEGAKAILAGSGAPIMIVESNPRMLKLAGACARKLRDTLGSFGYTCCELEQLTDQGDESVFNLLAVKKEHYSRFGGNIVEAAVSSCARIVQI